MIEDMALPPLHEVSGRHALRRLRENSIEFFDSTTRTGGDLRRVHLAPQRILAEMYVSHAPAVAERLYSAKSYGNFRKENRFYNQIRVAVGDGILTSWGEDWKRQKTFVQPIFTHKRVEGYLDVILAECEALAGRLRRGPADVDLGAAMTHFTLQVVSRVLFGGELGEGERVICEEFPRLNRAVVDRATALAPLPLSWPVPSSRRTSASQRALFDLCDRVIAERRKAPPSDDLASLLVAARDGEDHLSDREVREQILIFLLAGHETTSTTLTFVLHLLGRHPEVQQKVREEVVGVLGSGVPTAAQLMGELPYTTAAIKEAMRLYPAAPLNSRRAIEDDSIGGYDVPAGSDMVLSVWSLHRREDLWPEPLRFDPARFLGGQEVDRYAWLPFGAGPRACLGQHFSMMESVALVALLVRDFAFAAPSGSRDEVPVSCGITLYPLAPVRSIVSAR